MPKQSPQRTCLGGGGTHPKAALWRFVAGPDNQVWFDPTHKAPGRGAYVYPAPSFLNRALKTRGLSRKLNVQVPQDLANRVEAQLLKQLAAQLGLLKKAGLLVSGAGKVLEQGSASTHDYLLAQDAGADIAKKLAGQKVWQVMTKTELEALTGQANCSVLCFKKQQKTTALLEQIEQLQRERETHE
jgi:hypothetical protein